VLLAGTVGARQNEWFTLDERLLDRWCHAAADCAAADPEAEEVAPRVSALHELASYLLIEEGGV
jgi:hypothetical protein